MALRPLTNTIMGLAFWLNSKTEEVIEVDPNVDLHASVVAKNPEKFGIPSSFLDSLEAGELEMGGADEELMKRSIKNGWIRIHVWGTGSEITFDVSSISSKIMYVIYDFCLRLKKEVGKITNRTRITISPLTSGKTKEFLYSELADGSIFESKLNELVDYECGDSYWYNPKSGNLVYNGETHGSIIWEFPKVFGVTEKDIDDDLESGANGELESKVIKKGWWRVHLMPDGWLSLSSNSMPSKSKILNLISDMLVQRKEKTKHVSVDCLSGGSDSFEFNNGILESKLNEEMAAWWFDPRTEKFKEHPSNDHEVMVEKDPHWFGLEYEDLTGMAPKPLALQKGFVRVDVFPNYTHIELKEKPNGKMKDALTLVARKLYGFGMDDNHKIVVATDRGNGREYDGVLSELYSTEIFESTGGTMGKLNEVAEAADITACAQIIADIITSNTRVYDEVHDRVIEYLMDVVPASSEDVGDTDEEMEQSVADLESLANTLISVTLKKIERL